MKSETWSTISNRLILSDIYNLDIDLKIQCWLLTSGQEIPPTKRLAGLTKGRLDPFIL